MNREEITGNIKVLTFRKKREKDWKKIEKVEKLVRTRGEMEEQINVFSLPDLWRTKKKRTHKVLQEQACTNESNYGTNFDPGLQN